jgi:hypothetical protein
MLAKDPIVNIRIATSRTIHVLFSIGKSCFLCERNVFSLLYFLLDGYRQELEAIVFSEEVSMNDELNPGQVLDEILYYLSTDSDQDVRYFVEEFVSSDKLDVYQKRRDVEELEIAQQSKPPPPPAHSVVPDELKQDVEQVFVLRDEDETMESPVVADSPMDDKDEMDDKDVMEKDDLEKDDTDDMDVSEPKQDIFV